MLGAPPLSGIGPIGVSVGLAAGLVRTATAHDAKRSVIAIGMKGRTSIACASAVSASSEL